MNELCLQLGLIYTVKRYNEYYQAVWIDRGTLTPLWYADLNEDLWDDALDWGDDWDTLGIESWNDEDK